MPSNIQTAMTPRGLMTYKMTTVDDADRSFDLAFWQAQSAEARFAAAWEMVEFAWEFKKRPSDELRLQRSVSRLERL